MSFRSPPTISIEDVQNIIKKWRSEEKTMREDLQKPVLIFVGDAGTGKSSCIKVMCNITDQDALKKLNITDHGVCGTTVDKYRHESRYLIAVDIRGKLQNKNIGEYTDYVSKILKKEQRIDIIIGVVKACGDRNGDIDTLIESLFIICEESAKPFVVLMNKFDEVKLLNKEKQFEDRKRYLEEQCDQIRKKLTTQFESHPSHIHGVFPVSAEPNIGLGSECPECVEDTNETGDFLDATTRILIPGAALHCFKCKNVFIWRPRLKEEDLTKINKYAQSQQLYIYDYQPQPEGLDSRDDLMQAIIFLTHEIVSVAIMKSICKTHADRIQITTNDIRNVAKNIYGLSDAIELDKSLCEKIAGKFDLRVTASIHSEYEANCWKKVGTMDRFASAVRRFFDAPDKALPLYIAAWGIYYARKFCDIAATLNDGYKNGIAHEKLAEKCNQICAQYTEEDQFQYYESILKDGLEEALNKYILNYTGANGDISTKNKITKLNQSKLSKTASSS